MPGVLKSWQPSKLGCITHTQGATSGIIFSLMLNMLTQQDLKRETLLNVYEEHCARGNTQPHMMPQLTSQGSRCKQS